MGSFQHRIHVGKGDFHPGSEPWAIVNDALQINQLLLYLSSIVVAIVQVNQKWYLVMHSHCFNNCEVSVHVPSVIG